MSANGQNPARARRKVLPAFLKLTRFLFGFAAMLLLCGFAAFVLHVSRAAPPDTIVKVDGIVVLTGKGGGRLSAGGDLLKKQYAERLLVSGVNPATTPVQVQELLGLGDELYQCCVDLDYEAEDTIGNGLETANWARALGYENIILVTSAYHMPRAKLEISGAMKEINIIAYPVKSDKDANAPWWGGLPLWNRYFREYGKLLISYAREPGARPKPKNEQTDTP